MNAVTIDLTQLCNLELIGSRKILVISIKCDICLTNLQINCNMLLKKNIIVWYHLNV